MPTHESLAVPYHHRTRISIAKRLAHKWCVIHWAPGCWIRMSSTTTTTAIAPRHLKTALWVLEPQKLSVTRSLQYASSDRCPSSTGQ